VDELSASLDDATETLLFEALRAHCERTGATLLVVCHKIHGLDRLCDKVRFPYLFLPRLF
jgi:ABC-type glutathione transport system ATPase component